MGFPKLDAIFYIEYGLASALAHMHVDGAVIVAVEEEYESVLFKDSWQWC